MGSVDGGVIVKRVGCAGGVGWFRITADMASAATALRAATAGHL